MRATYLYGAGDVRVIDVPDPKIEQATDALVRVTRACVCGSDLHPYHSTPATDEASSIGHEFIGVVEEVGADVTTVAPGDFVIAPFAVSCGVCEFCRAGLQTSCVNGGFWNDARSRHRRRAGRGGARPLADGTLVAVPGVTEATDESLLASLLTLSDVYGTGWHAAVRGGVQPGSTVTVIGDGAVGLLAVLSAKQLGAERIVLMGRHQHRTDLGRDFGATDVVAERGADGIDQVRDLTDGGSPVVLEAVGHLPAYEQAVGVVRPGGVISRVGVPQYEEAPVGFGSLFGAQRHPHRWPGAGPRVHRAAAARRPGRQRPAGPGLRPHGRPGRHPRGVRRHGRPRGAQGDGPAVTTVTAPAGRAGPSPVGARCRSWRSS